MERKVENYVSPEDCRLELEEILNTIKRSYKNSLCNHPKKGEEVFTKKIKEVQNLFKTTGNICYNKIYKSAIKRYNIIIGKHIKSNPKFIRIDDAETNFTPPEEIEERLYFRKNLIEGE